MRGVLALVLVAASGFAMAQTPKEMSAESMNRGQTMADAIQSAAGTDAAFFAAGLVKEGSRGDLAAQVQYPSDEIIILKLSGAQIKDALERSISLHPSANPAFLYTAGMEVTFNAKNAPDSRITSVTINGSAMNATATYRVAMPGSLARGGLGYFSVWDKKHIESTVQGATVESALKGKSVSPSTSRWRAA